MHREDILQQGILKKQDLLCTCTALTGMVVVEMSQSRQRMVSSIVSGMISSKIKRLFAQAEGHWEGQT